MKYKFNTLEEVKTAIEQWFKDLGYDNKERAEKQYLKIIAEVGEMADALCKEDIENFKSEAGDVFVTIIGYCLQRDEFLDVNIHYPETNNSVNNHLDFILTDLTNSFFTDALESLNSICWLEKTTLLECATIAYNKIQERLENGQLKVINGTIQK